MSILRVDVARRASMVWHPYSPKLTTANGTSLSVQGQGPVKMTFDNNAYRHDFAVADAAGVSFSGLLGNDFLAKYGVGICYQQLCLQFEWGSFPLAFNRPAWRPNVVLSVGESEQEDDLTDSAAAGARSRRVSFTDDDQVYWISPPHDIEVFPGPLVSESSGYEESVRVEEPAGLRCSLVVAADGLLQPNAFHLVRLGVNAPQGTPLIVHGIDLGDGADPEPSFTTVNKESQITVLFKNTSEEIRQLNPKRLAELEIEEIQPELKVMLVNTTWEETSLTPYKCPLCEVREAEVGKLCPACDEQLLQEDDTVEFWPPETSKKLTVDEKMAFFDLSDVPPEHLEDFRQILLDHLDAFSFPGEPLGHFTEFEFEIDTGQARPVKQKPYRLAYAHREFVEKTIKDLLAQGIIRPSLSEWAAPLLLVPKKGADGKTGFRCVIDFRALNRITRTQVYPYPVIQDVLDALHGRPFRICMDIASSYWHCEINANSRHKTAFVCHLGQYEWDRVPYGLKNAGAHFCRVMYQVFGHLALEGLWLFIDDVMEATFTYPKLRALFIKSLQSAILMGVKFNPQKCQFMKLAMKFLGHVITPDGVLPDPDKTASIQSLPPPKTPTAVKSFLGMANFFKRFIPAYSEKALPLFGLTRGPTPKRVVWNEDHQEAFDALKAALSSPPCLIHPDFDREFHLVVFANSKGIGAALEQEPEGAKERRPVAHFSAKLSTSQQRYSQCQLECFAVVRAVEHFRVYLEGKKFHLYVRQSSLTWLFRGTPLKPVLARWVLRLQAFDFVVHNVKGATNPAEAHAAAIQGGEETPEGLAVPDEAAVIHQVAVKTVPLDMEKIKAQQSRDPLWSRCLEKLKASSEGLPEYVLDNRGLLYRRDGNRVRLCVPLESRAEILEHFHDSIWGAHWGTAKMVAAVNERFFWPRLREDVEQHVGTCLQ